MQDETRMRWTKLVEDLAGSGLTQRAFAKERGISFSSLRNWIYRLKAEARGLERAAKPIVGEKDLRLLPVELVASAPYGAVSAEATGIEMVLASGARLRFAAGTDVTYLRALASAL